MPMFADPDLQARIVREIRELYDKWAKLEAGIRAMISPEISASKRMLRLTLMRIELSICTVSTLKVMVVTIGLARADYEQLLRSVLPETPIYAVLHKCPELDRWSHEKPLFKCVIIECNPDEAMVLLDAAKQHCPEAVTDNLYGFKVSRAFNLIS